jgi:DNA-binding CsgD family transcriptional regulator
MDGNPPHLQTNGKAAPPPDLADDCDVTLSARERQLLRRSALGKSDKVIAREIGGTQQQIEMQRERLIDRLQIQSQVQLVTLAAQLASWPARRASGIYLRKGRR